MRGGDLVIIVNFITLIILALIFILLITTYLKSAFSDISILYIFTIFLTPIALFIVNFIYLLRSPFVYYSALPLLIPIIYTLHEKVKNVRGHRLYIKIKEYANDLVIQANTYELNLSTEDIRIRMHPKNKVSIIFNVYSNDDEKKMKFLQREFCKQFKNKFKNYDFEILVDKKKHNKYKYNNLQFN
jgi:hypothetical protein